MRDAGVEALVAAAPHNVRYLTGYHCSLEAPTREWMVRPGASELPAGPSLAVFSAHGAALIAGPGFAVDAVTAQADDVRIVGSLIFDERHSAGGERFDVDNVRTALERAVATPVIGVAEVLAERGLARSRIGVDLTGLPDLDLAALARALPEAELLDCHNLLRLIRMVKSPAEIELLRRAAALSERAGGDAARTLRRGESSADLAQRYRAAVSAGGADFDHATPTAGGMSFTGTGAHTFQPGETFAFDVGCCLDGYYADTQLTVAVERTPPAAVLECYEVVRHCVVDVGIAAMRVGVPASSVQLAMAEFLAAEGAQAFATGHGLGLEFRDYPILVPGSGLRIRDDCVDMDGDLLLETGMVLNVEATMFMAGFAAVGCEVTCVLDHEGAAALTPQDRSQIVLASP